MAIHLGRALPRASCNQPGRRSGNGPEGLRPHAAPIRSCSRWGLPCRACCQPRGALLPHPFTLTREAAGGLLSVALSLGSPPPDVIRHRVSMEPGLSSARCASSGFAPQSRTSAAAIQPADILDKWRFRARVKRAPRLGEKEMRAGRIPFCRRLTASCRRCRFPCSRTGRQPTVPSRTTSGHRRSRKTSARQR